MYSDEGKNIEKQYYVTNPNENVVQFTDESRVIIKIYKYDSTYSYNLFGMKANDEGIAAGNYAICIIGL